MHLHAAFVPPDGVRRALVDLVASQEAAPSHEPASGRFRKSTPESGGTAGPLLDVVEPHGLVLPITDFGFVAAGDARRLVDTLTDVCAALPAVPVVQVSGGAALVDPGDRSVWAEVSGGDDDLDAMRDIARSVVTGVEPLGFFRDRRQFKLRMPVATINDATTVEHLELVLAALTAYRSEPWAVDEVAILQRGSGVWRTLRIGSAPASP